jgi:hypothetical protein
MKGEMMRRRLAQALETEIRSPEGMDTVLRAFWTSAESRSPAAFSPFATGSVVDLARWLAARGEPLRR